MDESPRLMDAAPGPTVSLHSSMHVESMFLQLSRLRMCAAASSNLMYLDKRIKAYQQTFDAQNE